MDKFFKVTERGSTIKTEILAGITTFMAMAYILMVNAGMFATPYGEEAGNILGVNYGAIYIATALSAIVGTVLMGLLANLPLALASGMGLNAFFVYTICLNMGFTYANGLVLVLFDGLLFILLTVTGLRKLIFEAVPEAVKAAIPVGIGLFIAFLGLQNAGIVVNDSSTCVSLASFNMVTGGATWATVMPLVVTVGTVLAIAIMSYKKVKGGILYGILGGSIIYYVLGFTVGGFYDGFVSKLSFNPMTAFADFGKLSLGKVFTEGFDFSHFLTEHSPESLALLIVTSALAFCMVDMFDTMGTLYGTCAKAGMLEKNGDIPNCNKAMLADAVATATGAVCGTSTVTTFVESSAGVAEGGKTGLSSMVTAVLFAIAMFLSPVAALIPGCATAAALVYVGILMISAIKNINWDDASIAVPAFLTLSMMPFTYNISYGIAFGLISYIVIKLFTGKVKDIKAGTWIVGILFAAMFVLTH